MTSTRGAAREAGLKLVIDSDGHQTAALGYVEFGVGRPDVPGWQRTTSSTPARWKQIARLRKRRPR